MHLSRLGRSCVRVRQVHAAHPNITQHLKQTRAIAIPCFLLFCSIFDREICLKIRTLVVAYPMRPARNTKTDASHVLKEKQTLRVLLGQKIPTRPDSERSLSKNNSSNKGRLGWPLGLFEFSSAPRSLTFWRASSPQTLASGWPPAALRGLAGSSGL